MSIAVQGIAPPRTETAYTPTSALENAIGVALEFGRQHGHIRADLIDGVMNAEDFEREPFESMLSTAEEEGIEIEWMQGQGRTPRKKAAATRATDTTAGVDPATLYFRELGRLPLLTAKEEVALALAIWFGHVASAATNSWAESAATSSAPSGPRA